MKPLEKIIYFKIFGKFAHFRKFYTNASSLSYLLPPRTVVIGMLGSILKIPRDSYYDLFNEDDCQVSVSVARESVIKRITQSMNMLHNSYHKFLMSGKGTFKSFHSQCKLELLVSAPGTFIEYLVAVAVPPGSTFYPELEQRISQYQTGYGLYLGQRQFRADIEYLKTYTQDEITPMAETDILDSVCLQENVMEVSRTDDVHIVIEHMPIHMRQAAAQKKLPAGREPGSVKGVLFERNGRRLHGKFKNCCKIDDRVISFY